MIHFVKIIFFLPPVIVLTLFLYLCAYLPQSFTDSFYRVLIKLWCNLFTRGVLGVDLRLIHKNTKPLPNHYILIANHPSSFEDFGMPACFDIYPLAKEGVRNWFLLGRMAEHAGAIFFKRDSSSSRHAAKETMIQALNDGKNIVLFPEGGCMGKRIHKEFKSGAFDASLKTGLPIIPVFLHYEDQEAFEWLNSEVISKI